MDSFAEYDWERLLTGIAEGVVVPIVGQGVVTFGDEDRPLYPELVSSLSQRLLGADKEPATLNELAYEHLLRGGNSNDLYASLSAILTRGKFEPGPSLQKLAEVGFPLYLTTAFDPLLERAVRAARGACDVGAFAPAERDKDLPASPDQLKAAFVYHLLGRCRSVPGSFVAWEKDLLDFLAELPRHLASEGMRHLSEALHNASFLALGLQLSDWVLRLVLRIAGQDKDQLVRNTAWVAENEVAASSVLFFGRATRNVRVVTRAPAEFVAELHERWKREHGASGAQALRDSRQAPPPPGAVFVSYAREDAEAARRIKEQLESQGCTVWLDRERLQVGQDFNQEIAREVLRDCAVFISVVSAYTEQVVGDRYFHRERNWAAKRLEGFPQSSAPKFYLPFIISEGLTGELLREPEVTRTFQRTRCADGVLDADTAQKVRALQDELRRR